MSTEERWAPILGYEGRYEVSDHGRLRTLPRKRARRGGIMRGSWSGGYNLVTLRIDGQRTIFKVHRLVATAFIRPPLDGEVCRHLNGNPSDNRVSNLAWGTQADNIADTVSHGRHTNKEKSHCKRGHSLEGARIYRGRRHCRECGREYDRTYYQRQKARLTAEAAA